MGHPIKPKAAPVKEAAKPGRTVAELDAVLSMSRDFELGFVKGPEGMALVSPATLIRLFVVMGLPKSALVLAENVGKAELLLNGKRVVGTGCMVGPLPLPADFVKMLGVRPGADGK